MDPRRHRPQSPMLSHPPTVAEEAIAGEVEAIGTTTEEAEEAFMRNEKAFALEAGRTTVYGIETGSGIGKWTGGMMT